MLIHTAATNPGAIGQLMNDCCCDDDPDEEEEDCCQFIQRYKVYCIKGCVGNALLDGISGMVDDGSGEFEEWVTDKKYKECERFQFAGKGYIPIQEFFVLPEGQSDYTFDNNITTGIIDFVSNVTTSRKFEDPFLNKNEAGVNICSKTVGTVERDPEFSIVGDEEVCGTFVYRRYGVKLRASECDSESSGTEFPDDIDTSITGDSDPCTQCGGAGPTDCFGRMRPGMKCIHSFTSSGSVINPIDSQPLAIPPKSDELEFQNCGSGGISANFLKQYSDPIADEDVKNVVLRFNNAATGGWEMFVNIRKDGVSAPADEISVQLKLQPQAVICSPIGTYTSTAHPDYIVVVT